MDSPSPTPDVFPFFCLPEFSASHHQLSNPFFLGNCFDIKLKTSPAPQWCCRHGETGGAGGISWANEARGIWHLWAGCDRAPGGPERPLSGGPEKSLVAGLLLDFRMIGGIKMGIHEVLVCFNCF